MTKKKTTLPEHIITDKESTFSKVAKKALGAREQVNKFTADEKNLKEIISKNAETLRTDSLINDKVIGKILITPPDQAAVRVEFRISNGSLDISDMSNLDKLFGVARPSLFEKAKVVDVITDPNALLKALHNAGLNPWDHVELRVKGNQDQIIIDKGDGFTTAEAILPKKGLLALLPSFIKHFSKEAKEYISEYLKQALKPTVVLGTKIKS